MALVIQDANRMRLVIQSSVACLAPIHFSTLSHKRQDFFFGGGGKLLNIKFVFWFSLQFISKTFFILKRIQRDIINVSTSLCKIPVILVRLCWNLHFLDRFSKKAQLSNLINIRPEGAELFDADGQTDDQRQTERHDEAKSRVLKFCGRAKNYFVC
jgi:hypothetical protein